MMLLVSDDDDAFELLFIIERQGKQFFFITSENFLFTKLKYQVINYNWRAKKKKVLQRIEKEFVIKISFEGKVIWKWYLGERKIVLEEYREAKFFSSPRNFCTYVYHTFWRVFFKKGKNTKITTFHFWFAILQKFFLKLNTYIITAPPVSVVLIRHLEEDQFYFKNRSLLFSFLEKFFWPVKQI